LRVKLKTKPASAAGARKGLEEVSRKLRALGPAHTAAADVLLLYARTVHW